VYNIRPVKGGMVKIQRNDFAEEANMCGSNFNNSSNSSNNNNQINHVKNSQHDHRHVATPMVLIVRLDGCSEPSLFRHPNNFEWRRNNYYENSDANSVQAALILLFVTLSIAGAVLLATAAP